MTIGIVNNRIEGTRITVWDVYLYQIHRTPREEVCDILSISPAELAAAERFIAENPDYVEKVHQEIEERIRRREPPEIEAKLEQTRSRMQAWLVERRRELHQEANGEGHPL